MPIGIRRGAHTPDPKPSLEVTKLAYLVAFLMMVSQKQSDAGFTYYTVGARGRGSRGGRDCVVSVGLQKCAKIRWKK